LIEGCDARGSGQVFSQDRDKEIVVWLATELL
jgi:hypothetical protein